MASLPRRLSNLSAKRLENMCTGACRRICAAGQCFQMPQLILFYFLIFERIAILLLVAKTFVQFNRKC